MTTKGIGMKKWMVCLATLFLAACVSTSPKQPPLFGEQTKVFRPFDQIRVEGPFNVSLHTGFKQPKVVLSGDMTSFSQIHMLVRNGVLFIGCDTGCSKKGPFSLRIQTHHLRSFAYRGKGTIVGKKLHTTQLNLDIKNRGVSELGGRLGLRQVKISGGGYVTLTGVEAKHLNLWVTDRSKAQLAGKITLGGLILDDGSWVSLHWLRANQLKIRARDKTVVQMAGVAKLIDVELWDHAQFKGRYLKTEQTYVKTHDFALAEITTTEHQHTLATDSSDIYFYRVPETKANYMAYEGSVLDLRLFNPKLQHDPYRAFNL